MKKLAEINAFRLAQGLEPFATLPGTMRPGKTARKNKAAQNANRAAKAQANRDMKDNRQRRGR